MSENFEKSIKFAEGEEFPSGTEDSSMKFGHFFVPEVFLFTAEKIIFRIEVAIFEVFSNRGRHF
jgi:hypothetical protein